MELRTVGDIVIDTRRVRVWFLEHHAHAPTQLHNINTRRVYIVTIEKQIALRVTTGNQIGHAVHRVQERTLPTTRWSDQGRDHFGGNIHIDGLHGFVIAIEHRKVFRADCRGLVAWSFWRFTPLHNGGEMRSGML